MSEENEVELPEELIGNPVLLSKVQDIGLDKRTSGSLLGNGIYFTAQIFQHLPDILNARPGSGINQFGPKGRKALEKALKAYGVKLCKENMVQFPDSFFPDRIFFEPDDMSTTLAKICTMFKIHEDAEFEPIKDKSEKTTPEPSTVRLTRSGRLTCEIQLAPVITAAIKQGLLPEIQRNFQAVADQFIRKTTAELVELLKKEL